MLYNTGNTTECWDLQQEKKKKKVACCQLRQFWFFGSFLEKKRKGGGGGEERYGIRNRTLWGLQIDDTMDILSVNSPVWE